MTYNITVPSNVVRTDVRRLINFKRGDIYVCQLDEDYTSSEINSQKKLFSTTGLIGKKRPCIIWSNNEYNSTNRNTYTVIPIKTNHTDKSSEDYVNTSYDILVPIFIEGEERFVVVSQARPLNSKCILSYFGTITNPDLLDTIEKEFVRYQLNNTHDIDAIFKQYGSLSNALEFLNSKFAKDAYSKFKSLRK